MLAWLTPNSIPASGDTVCRRLSIPNEQTIRAAVLGALYPLTRAENWEKFGDVDPDAIAYRMLEMFEDFAESTCEDSAMMPLGAVFPHMQGSPPTGCVDCDGDTYLMADYPAFAAVIDPAWIDGDGQHFTVPDLHDRFVAGPSTGQDPGEKGGATQFTLADNQLPAGAGFLDHTPVGGSVSGVRYGVSTPVNMTLRYLLTNYGQPVTHIPPYQLINWAVRIE